MKKTGLLCSLGVILILVGCRSSMERSEYPAAVPQYQTWEAVLEHPSDLEWEVWNTGWIQIPSKGVIDIKNHPLSGLEDTIRVPVPVTYVSHPLRGGLLFDTGLNSGYSEDRTDLIKGLLNRIILPEGEGDASMSASSRLKGRKISTVLFTHLHFDHTGGAAEIRGVDEWIAGRGETEIDIPLLFDSKHLDHISNLQELDFENARSLPPFDAVLDVFGDNSVFAISTKGHTKSHVSYLLNTKSGPVVIAGDGVNIPQNLQYRIGPGSYSSDLDQAENSFNNILEFLNTYPQTRLIYGHSMEIYNQERR